MPSDNIERAIKKGTGGGEDANFDDLTYEIYGPGGVALLVESAPTIATAPPPKSAASSPKPAVRSPPRVRSAASFSARAKSSFDASAGEEDRLMELALDAGAEDFKAEPEGYEILTEPNAFEAVHKQDRGRRHQTRRRGSYRTADDHGSIERRTAGRGRQPTNRGPRRPRRRQGSLFKRRISR